MHLVPSTPISPSLAAPSPVAGVQGLPGQAMAGQRREVDCLAETAASRGQPHAPAVRLGRCNASPAATPVPVEGTIRMQAQRKGCGWTITELRATGLAGGGPARAPGAGEVAGRVPAAPGGGADMDVVHGFVERPLHARQEGMSPRMDLTLQQVHPGHAEGLALQPACRASAPDRTAVRQATRMLPTTARVEGPSAGSSAYLCR